MSMSTTRTPEQFVEKVSAIFSTLSHKEAYPWLQTPDDHVEKRLLALLLEGSQRLQNSMPKPIPTREEVFAYKCKMLGRKAILPEGDFEPQESSSINQDYCPEGMHLVHLSRALQRVGIHCDIMTHIADIPTVPGPISLNLDERVHTEIPITVTHIKKTDWLPSVEVVLDWIFTVACMAKLRGRNSSKAVQEFFAPVFQQRILCRNKVVNRPQFYPYVFISGRTVQVSSSMPMHAPVVILQTQKYT